MAARGDGAPHSVIIPVSELRTKALGVGGAAGTDCARFYAPSLPDSNGIVVRGARLFISDEVGSSTTPVTFDIMNQTTTMLSATLAAAVVGASSFTLAGNGTEVIAPGRYVRIDMTGATMTSTLGFTGMSVQLDYDRL
jgi:hypothetical protein